MFYLSMVLLLIDYLMFYALLIVQIIILYYLLAYVCSISTVCLLIYGVVLIDKSYFLCCSTRVYHSYSYSYIKKYILYVCIYVYTYIEREMYITRGLHSGGFRAVQQARREEQERPRLETNNMCIYICVYIYIYICRDIYIYI